MVPRTTIKFSLCHEQSPAPGFLPARARRQHSWGTPAGDRQVPRRKEQSSALRPLQKAPSPPPFLSSGEFHPQQHNAPSSCGNSPAGRCLLRTSWRSSFTSYTIGATINQVFMEEHAANSSNGGSKGAGSVLDRSVLGGMSVDECQKVIKKSFKLPMVRFLREELEKAGCPVKEKFFKAMSCDRKATGSYIRGEGIVVCANHVNFDDEINQVIIHELIHAYDDCRAANMNWLNCAHHACSEIRAGHLSGDCYFKRELLRGHVKLRGHEQECIRRRVMLSLANNPYCTQAAAKDAMEAVWDTCYNDTKPFDRAP